MLTRLSPMVALIGLATLNSAGCGRRPEVVQTGPVVAATPSTTLTPDSPPLCGDFGRGYIAPGSQAGNNNTLPAPGLGVFGQIDSRIFREGESFKTYPTEDQDLIRSGRARVGLDEKAVYLANGLPAFYWNTSIDDVNCRVMLYGVLGDQAVDTAVYTCGAEVIHIGPVQPGLPCWRLKEVAPRAIERAGHFDGLGVEEQWELLHGLLRRGQSTDDIYVGFGTPYRTGAEAREDGTNAAQHVYLDTTGDAYSMYLTFVERNLRGWRFPPDRRLTVEAEQRRLDALERRMMDQMRDIEEASIARHRTELAHLNQIQTNQSQIRTDIADARTAIIDSVESEGSRTRRAVRSQNSRGVAGAAVGAAIRGAGPVGPGRPGMGRRNSNVEQEVDHRSSVTMEGGATVIRSRTQTRTRTTSN